MNPQSLFLRTLAVSLLLGSHAANAACVITDVMPTEPLPTMDGGQEFSFNASKDCETFRFSVPGTTLVKTMKGDRSTYDLHLFLTKNEWDSVVGEDDTTLTWTIEGKTSDGVTTTVTTRNELDVDGDGWTRGDGDVGECDYETKINPGEPEDVCNLVDDDCDGWVGELPHWFSDPHKGMCCGAEPESAAFYACISPHIHPGGPGPQ